ncbi:Protein of unknown function [Leuconostoc citreum LBAE E16]|nr:Protein of unknown function [Leuconostoc citreum LBAE E16]
MIVAEQIEEKVLNKFSQVRKYNFLGK